MTTAAIPPMIIFFVNLDISELIENSIFIYIDYNKVKETEIIKKL